MSLVQLGTMIIKRIRLQREVVIISELLDTRNADSVKLKVTLSNQKLLSNPPGIHTN